MKITNLTENTEDFTGNIWLLTGESEQVLVDVGTGDSWENIRELELVDKVVITHSHYDHVDNLPKIIDKFDPEVYAFEPDNLPMDAEALDEGSSINLIGADFQIYHTPGHKNDSICLYSPDEKVLFTGDLLFPDGGFGRTDLEEGDRDLLIQSIKKIVGLEVEEMYCGHDEEALENVEDQIQNSLKEAEKKEEKY